MTDEEFSKSLTDFYIKLRDSQEPTDPVFEDILHENLWDLLT